MLKWKQHKGAGRCVDRRRVIVAPLNNSHKLGKVHRCPPRQYAVVNLYCTTIQSDNKIEDEGAASLGSALRLHRSMKVLYYCCCLLLIRSYISECVVKADAEGFLVI
jgi:hypothetical protein